MILASPTNGQLCMFSASSLPPTNQQPSRILAAARTSLAVDKSDLELVIDSEVNLSK